MIFQRRPVKKAPLKIFNQFVNKMLEKVLVMRGKMCTFAPVLEDKTPYVDA